MNVGTGGIRHRSMSKRRRERFEDTKGCAVKIVLQSEWLDRELGPDDGEYQNDKMAEW